MRRPERRGENWKIERWGSDGARADEEELANPEGFAQGEIQAVSIQRGGRGIWRRTYTKERRPIASVHDLLGRPVDTLPGVVELRRWVELASKLQMQQPSREPGVALSSPKSVARPLLP